MFIIRRKAMNVPEGKARVYLFWTGADWTSDRTRAKEFTSRDEALEEHAVLAGGDYPAGGSPVVCEC